MPGPNDFHFDAKGQLQPGLGPTDPRADTKTYVAPPRAPRADGRTPRVDGRTAEGRRLKAEAHAAAEAEG